MGIQKFVCRLLLLGLLSLILPACSEQAAQPEKPKELLVYCGITMIKPMSEIARIIEEKENCRIIITKDGSGNLLKSIRTNQVGDLFLPGAESYMKTSMEEGLVSEAVFVGENKAAMMVRKGNPKNIPEDLESLANSDYYVVIGNPNSGSIGRETKKILEKRGIYDAVMSNAKRLTTDSKDLVGVLVEGEADLVINWYAVSVWPENEAYIDVLAVDDAFAEKKRLLLGLLKYSKYPEIAKKFMAYASSPDGQDVFRRYGFLDVK